MISKTKVLHILGGLGMGGAETWLLDCLRLMNQGACKDVEFHFLLTNGTISALDEYYLAEGAKLFYVKFNRNKIIDFIRQFRFILKSEKYDVIHSHSDFLSGWYFLFGLGLLPNCRVSHVHNPLNFVRNYQTNILRKFNYFIGRQLMIKLCTGITGTSSNVIHEYGYMQGTSKRKVIRPLYCGINVKRFLFDEHVRFILRSQLTFLGKKVVVFAGRIDSDERGAVNQKNAIFAFECAKKIILINDEVVMVFLGDKGTYGRELEKEISHSVLFKNRILFLGVVQNIEDYFFAADLLLFPSLWEGLGMVLVEAQASGLRSLCSDSVPDESTINDELIFKLSLNLGVDLWATKAMELLSIEKTNRVKDNDIVRRSHFEINNSFSNLIKSYYGH